MNEQIMSGTNKKYSTLYTYTHSVPRTYEYEGWYETLCCLLLHALMVHPLLLWIFFGSYLLVPRTYYEYPYYKKTENDYSKTT